jgi:DNA-binding transcriptional MerR regulator
MAKGPDAFRTISEVARELDVPQHVLRFWESRFAQVRPMKRGGGRRYYRPEDIALLKGIHKLLYSDGFTIRGVQKILRERGVQHVVANSPDTAAQPAAADSANIVALQPRREAAHPPAGAAPGERPAAASPLRGELREREVRTVVQAALEELGALKSILERARE